MSWLQLAQQLSADVVSKLAAAGLPPLLDGAILLGPDHVSENAAAPRIVMVPVGSDFNPRRESARGGRNNPLAPGHGVLYAVVTQQGKGYTTANVTFPAPPSGTTATGVATVNDGAVIQIRITNPGSGYMAAPTPVITGDGTGASAESKLTPDIEALAEMSANAIWSDSKHYEVHVWGVTYSGGSPAPNPDSDWDFTESMYQTILQSCQDLMAGCYTPSKGEWRSSSSSAMVRAYFGRYYVFDLEIKTPVPRVTRAFVPVGTLAKPTVQFQPADGSAPQTP